jgi:hypothetical protein
VPRAELAAAWIVSAADPTGGLGWITTGGLVSITLFILWAFLKTPPLFVPWREHFAVLERNRKLEEENARIAEAGRHVLDSTETLQRLLRETITALAHAQGAST